MIKPTLVLTYVLPARPQRVFDILTQAEHLNRWFTSGASVDLQVGGKFANADGDQGKFLKVAVPRHLVFTYGHSRLPVETEVDMTFVASGRLGGTTLRLVQKGLDPKSVPPEAYSWMTERWNYMAAGLGRYIARKSRLPFDTWKAFQKPVYETRP